MGLLQYLCLECTCENISDLNIRVHNGRFHPKLHSALLKADAAQWSCKEWKDAVLYITQKNITADNAEAYRKTLIWLIENYPSPNHEGTRTSSPLSPAQMRHNLQAYFKSILMDGCSNNASHFFLGDGGREELLALRKMLEKEFAGIRIAGMYTLSHSTPSAKENVQICQLINEAKPDIIWVGFSGVNPKYWILEQKSRLPNCVMISVDTGLGFLLETI